MSRLTDPQLVILAAAAARPNHAVLPSPATLTLNKAALTKVINSLLRRALIAETPASAGDAIWREDGNLRLTLAITKAGLDAIGVDVGKHSLQLLEIEEHPVTSQPSPRRGSGKVEAVLSLLRRHEGASIADINAVTDWQAHSIRAFLSGLRKKGMEIARTKDESGKALYTLAPEFLAEG
jgi:hypothetical protein